MNADDFRDYMLSFLFLRYLSGNYEESAKKELGRDYPDDTPPDVMSKLKVNTPLEIWYIENPDDVVDFEKQMRRKVHYVVKPEFLWNNITELARTQDVELSLSRNRDLISCRLRHYPSILINKERTR